MKRNSNNKKEEMVSIKISDRISIDKVREIKGGTIMFTLITGAAYVYGCRVVEGRNGDFIAFPSYKGTDGNYYNHCYVSLTDAEQQKILEEIDGIING